MAIFHHQDGNEPNVNYVEILAPEGRNVLQVMCQSPGDGLGDVSTSCTVDRDAVLRLHAALGEWLYPVHTPEWANKSLIEQMIERAVKDQVAAVLPLHLKPGDRFLMTDADGRVWAGPAKSPGCECGHPANFHSEENGCCHWYTGEQEFCDCTRGLGGLESDAFPGADPEPHDVGHAEEPTGPYTPPVHMTTEDKCQVHACGSRHLAAEPETDHGRLMSELPVRTRPRPICVSCGHGWGEHTSGVCWGDDPRVPGGLGCRCTRERPGPAPAPCTCDMQHSHRPVIRNGSPATCAYRDCECKYRSTS